MAWKLEGNFFENCSCEMPCPCLITMDAGADYDRCTLPLVFHIESGEVDGVDVSGLGAVIVLDAPKVMTEGNWRVGVVIDEAASDEQAEKLGAVFSGQMGGPLEAILPLVGEIMGLERARFEWSEDGLEHRVRIGDSLEVGVEDVVPFGSGSDTPVQVTNVVYPAGSTLTISRGKGSKGSLFGVDLGHDGKSGFSAPFSWAG
jgi:hypothetical protein